MNSAAWLAVAVVVACLGFLLATPVAPELILLGGVGTLVVLGVLTPDQALEGFANEGMVTVALMYVVVAGIRETGGVDHLVRYVLGRPKSLGGALLRLSLPVAAISAFMNNTPLVAIFLPAVLSWAKRLQISPSKLLIPLSYAAVFGGTISLIGTSTNLIVNGLLVSGHKGALGLFDIAWVGVPCTVLGILYLWLFGPRFLPERKPASAVFENPKEYTVEMTVEERGPLLGKTIEEAGLRHLQGLYLVEIGRGDEVLAAVGPYERLQAGTGWCSPGSPIRWWNCKGSRALGPLRTRPSGWRTRSIASGCWWRRWSRPIAPWWGKPCGRGDSAWCMVAR